MKVIKPPKNIIDNQRMPMWFWLFVSFSFGLIIGTIISIVFKN